MKSSEYKNRGFNVERALKNLEAYSQKKEKALVSGNPQELSLCGGRQAPYLVPLEGSESEKKNRQSD